MATLAQGMAEAAQPPNWLRVFLRDELSPYPGRMATVARMTLAVTLVMLVCEIFRVPFAFQAAVFALLISRESPQATVRSAGTILFVTLVGAAYLLTGAWFVVSIPWLHFLFNIVSFFLAFYGIATLTNYSAAVPFAIMVAVGVPVWDTLAPAEANVELTLRVLLSALIGVAAALRRECRPGDVLVRSGDDEFIVLAQIDAGRTPIEAAERFVGAVRAMRMTRPYESERVTASAGGVVGDPTRLPYDRLNDGLQLAKLLGKDGARLVE